jgi:hypothetical protein
MGSPGCWGCRRTRCTGSGSRAPVFMDATTRATPGSTRPCCQSRRPAGACPGLRYEGHGWDPKGPASIHRARAALDKDSEVIGYVFESKGFSRVDIDTNESDPGYSLAGQLMGLPLKPLQSFGVPAESYGLSDAGEVGFDRIKTFGQRQGSREARPRRQGSLLTPRMCRQCRSRVRVAGLSSSFRTRLPWRANAGAFCAPTATFASGPVRVKTTLSFRASFRRYALCLSPI